MANMEYLQEGVRKATEKVEKCKGTIKRHEDQLQKKQKAMAAKNGAHDVWEAYDIESKQDDIKGATKKLKEAEAILANWKAKLDKEVEIERFIAGNAPKVIVEFLERWKKMAFEWHVKRYDDFLKFKEQLKKDELRACKAYVEENKALYGEYLNKSGKLPKDNQDWNFFHNYCHPRKPLDAYLKSQKLDWSSITQRENQFAGGVVLRMYAIRDEKGRLDYLEKTLEEDRKAKMIDLISRVNAVVGSITDASLLKIDVKGNLNGIVAGKKDKAKVETIGAGGWNIQCFHYRTLVHKLNEKKGK